MKNVTLEIFILFSFLFLHLANIIIAKGIGLMFPLKQLLLDSVG